jgi:hypothetical protein
MSEKRAVTSLFFSPPSVFLFLDQGLSARESTGFSEGGRRRRRTAKKLALVVPLARKRSKGETICVCLLEAIRFVSPLSPSLHTLAGRRRKAQREQKQGGVFLQEERNVPAYPCLSGSFSLFLFSLLFSPAMAHASVLYLENFVESASRFLLATKKPFSL